MSIAIRVSSSPMPNPLAARSRHVTSHHIVIQATTKRSQIHSRPLSFTPAPSLHHLPPPFYLIHASTRISPISHSSLVIPHHTTLIPLLSSPPLAPSTPRPHHASTATATQTQPPTPSRSGPRLIPPPPTTLHPLVRSRVAKPMSQTDVRRSRARTPCHVISASSGTGSVDKDGIGSSGTRRRDAQTQTTRAIPGRSMSGPEPDTYVVDRGTCNAIRPNMSAERSAGTRLVVSCRIVSYRDE